MTKTLLAATLLAATLPAAHAASYHEGFDDGQAQRWELQDASAWSIVPASDGNLHERVTAAADATQVASVAGTFAGRTVTDFQYAVTVADNGMRPTYVLARATGDFGTRYDAATAHTSYTGSGYAFGIGCSAFVYKAFYFYKVVDGVATVIAPWTSVPGLRCSGDITQGDRLKVVAQGATIRLYVNGQRVLSWTDPAPILSGRVGYYHVTDTQQPSWSDFDDVAVKPLATTAAATAAAPSTATPASTAALAFDALGQPLRAR